MNEPRHANKEVRQVIDWAKALGYAYDGDDASGHPYYVHGNGHRIKFPTTPTGWAWRDNIERDVRRNVGLTTNKRNTTAIRERNERTAILRRAAAQRARELREAVAKQADRRQRLIQDEAELNRYAALMGVGHHSGGYRRSPVG